MPDEVAAGPALGPERPASAGRQRRRATRCRPTPTPPAERAQFRPGIFTSASRVSFSVRVMGSRCVGRVAVAGLALLVLAGGGGGGPGPVTAGGGAVGGGGGGGG